MGVAVCARTGTDQKNHSYEPLLSLINWQILSLKIPPP